MPLGDGTAIPFKRLGITYDALAFGMHEAEIVQSGRMFHGPHRK
jgi:hypothetical protein